MKKFVYFVSFTFSKSKDSYGYGNCSVTLERPITTQADINDIERMLENNKPYMSAIVLNYQLLREIE